jgi:hypothetical protein
MAQQQQQQQALIATENSNGAPSLGLARSKLDVDPEKADKKPNTDPCSFTQQQQDVMMVE